MRIKPIFHLLVLVVSILSGPTSRVLGQDLPGPTGAFPSLQDTGPDAAQVSEVLKSRLRPVCDDGSRALQSRRLAGEKAPAVLNAIVLMVDFSDSLMYGRYGMVPGDFPPPMQTDRYYSAHDSIYFQGVMQDVADYFTEVSGGRLTINSTIHARTVNLPEPMWFYGDNPTEGEQQILLAATLVDSLDGEINFIDYDTVILVHAGAGQETDILGDSPEQIFSTYLDPDDFAAAYQDSVLETPYIPASGYPAGMGIDRVLILPETEQQDPVGSFDGGFGSLGVYCFEVGLHLGMLSLSDFTPSGRPDSQGIGNFGLMGYGLFVGLGFIPPHPCAFNKTLMGWLEPYEAEPMAQAVWHLTPSEQPADPLACARVPINGQEYWLIEYRLQDPNGDRRFSFSDDLNGNGVPDFYDADSDSGDGTPTGKFDPATDTRERSTDAEWDFALTENNARGQGELAAGSGVLVWHIDEGVIEDVFASPSNLFNADPQRKSVDLEEADRIQDLDSSQPSDYMLGSDEDSYRAEDTSVFGPNTLPPTDTASGARTGLVFQDFSKVVVDSQAYVAEWNSFTYWGYDYADTMSFLLSAELDSATGPVMSARRVFPAGTDLTGSHVLLANLAQTGTQDQIILAGQVGEIFVLDGDLNEYLDHDGDPATLEPFAIGSRQGTPVAWNLPPAAGDLDGDGELDIILTGPDGLYAFRPDGTPLRDIEPGAQGLYVGLGDCGLPPILVPRDFQGPAGSSGYIDACVVVAEMGETHLRFYGGPSATSGLDVNLGQVSVPSQPVLAGEFLLTAVADTLNRSYKLHVLDLTPSAVPEDPYFLDLPLALEPGPYPVSWGITPDSAEDDPVYFAVIVDQWGQGETVYFDDSLMVVQDNVVWSQEVEILSPISVGGAFTGPDVLGRTGSGGFWQDGWPVRPLWAVAPVGGPGAASPLVARLADSPQGPDQYIFPVRDGRLLGLNTQGEAKPGWPLAGPARSAGSPALGMLGGEALMDLVAVGSFPRITGTDNDSEDLATEFVSEVTLWRDVAMAGAVWPMSGGSSWRNGSYDAQGWLIPPDTSSGSGLVAGSHFCYPSPLLAGPLFVRGQVYAQAQAQAFIYNLSGEQMIATGWQTVGGVDPFSIEVELGGVASGMYICRLVVEAEDGNTDYSVVQFAVVR